METNNPWRMHRAYRNLLGLNSSAVPPPIEVSLQQISLSPNVRSHLFQLLELKGEMQTGIVFGHREHDYLHLLHFAYGSARGQSDVQPPPFRWQTSYLRGCVDTLLASQTGEIDWYGVWMIAPNSEQFSSNQILEYAQIAHARGLVDDQQVLISVGWSNGILDLQAFKFLDADTPVGLLIHL